MPVTVSVYKPGAADDVVLIDSVELPPDVTDVGLSVAVTPVGAPLTARVTVCAEPLVVAVEIVELVEPPAVTEPLVGLAEIEKSLVAMLAMHAPCEFDHSFWIVYVMPSPPTNVPWFALQMSPISPFVVSYQASGGPTTLASPTSASVIVSTISCDATDV